MGPKVKNKASAPLQISAEQILLEAYERQEKPLKIQQMSIQDREEQLEYQGRKRKEYEDALRRNRLNMGQWMRYATWEFEQREFERGRSVFERALDVDPAHIPLWIRYINSELKERNINHARNLLDRAVTILPRVDKLWYQYVQTEEMLSNVVGCRQVFDRWMKWRPAAPAWLAYIDMEKRYREYEYAREIFKVFTVVHPEPENWVKWARFEEEIGDIDRVREVFTLAIDKSVAMGNGDFKFVDERLLIQWAKFEARQREWERSRAIYKFGLEKLPKSKSEALYNQYTKFEKQYGEKEGIEDVVLSKRRTRYEQELKETPNDYDIWFSYLTLVEESSNSNEEIRDIFERAIAVVPDSSNGKGPWRRYIYLWIRYAFFEELTARDLERARQVYQLCIKTIPHKLFSFAKIWLLYAKFEIRNGDLSKARKILGQAIAKSGKPRILKGYIELEKKLKDFDRCRVLYEKYIEKYPQHSSPWIEYATMEGELGDYERARGIFALAIQQPEMELPELVWKRYIEFETEIGNAENARHLYEQLLKQTGNVKVWISYAVFEVTLSDEDAEDAEDEDEEEELVVTKEAKERARKVFDRAWSDLKQRSASNEDRVQLHQAWLEFEETYGGDDPDAEEALEKVKKHTPSVVRKRRELEDGTVEEYNDYIFPTDEQDKGVSKLLANALKWKKQQQK